MPVSINKSGKTITATVAIDATAILDSVGMQARDIKIQVLQSLQRELAESVAVAVKLDAELDAEIAAKQAEVTRLKALRPTGNF